MSVIVQKKSQVEQGHRAGEKVRSLSRNAGNLVSMFNPAFMLLSSWSWHGPMIGNATTGHAATLRVHKFITKFLGICTTASVGLNNL